MARILHHLKKKYEIDRMLERMSLELYEKHEECSGVSFGEATRLDEPTATGSNWTAEISGGTKEGRDKFEHWVDQLQRSNRMRD